MWNNSQYFTNNSFREHVQKIAHESMRGHRIPTLNGVKYPPLWWINGEIRVFWEKEIPERTVRLIVESIDSTIRKTIKESFHFVLLGSHKSAIEQIKITTRSGIDFEHLFALSLSEEWRIGYGGYQHGDIYITNKLLEGDNVSWGACSFNSGTMILALYERYLNYNFLKKVVTHEALHLLGMYCHCDDYQNVEGYDYIPSCNAHYSCLGSEVCPKCSDLIRHWWRQIKFESKKL